MRRGIRPNPRQKLFIDIAKTQLSNYRLTINDLSGRELLTIDRRNLMRNQEILEVDTSLIKEGIYLLNLYDGQEYYSLGRLIIRH